MFETRCPTCRKRVRTESLADSPDFPFCNSRCRMADLERWFTEDYAIPGELLPSENGEERDGET